MADRIANIGEIGARRRRAGGYVWIAVSVIVVCALLLMHAPRAWRAVLVIPFTLAATGFVQARAKT